MEYTFRSSIHTLHSKDPTQYNKALKFLIKYYLKDYRSLIHPYAISLLKNDLKRIHHLVNNSTNKLTRILSAKFLCELTYNNSEYQSQICEIFDFNNFQGKVFFYMKFR